MKSNRKNETRLERSSSDKVRALSHRRIFSGQRTDREMIRVVTCAVLTPVLMALPGVGRAQSMPRSERPAEIRVVENQEDPGRLVEWERVADYRIDESGQAASAQPSDAGASVQPSQGGQAAPAAAPGAGPVNQSAAPVQASPQTKNIVPAANNAPAPSQTKTHQIPPPPMSFVIEAPRAEKEARQPVARVSHKSVAPTKQMPSELPSTSIIGS